MDTYARCLPVIRKDIEFAILKGAIYGIIDFYR